MKTFQNWPFDEAVNTAVITSQRILSGSDWIYYVTHDADDGGWQFHPSNGMTTEVEAAVVGLKTLVDIDSSICLLADLPEGWHAWRKTKNAEWHRARQESN
jgi:hypothetical protein